MDEKNDCFTTLIGYSVSVLFDQNIMNLVQACCHPALSFYFLIGLHHSKNKKRLSWSSIGLCLVLFSYYFLLGKYSGSKSVKAYRISNKSVNFTNIYWHSKGRYTDNKELYSKCDVTSFQYSVFKYQHSMFSHEQILISFFV